MIGVVFRANSSPGWDSVPRSAPRSPRGACLLSVCRRSARPGSPRFCTPAALLCAPAGVPAALLPGLPCAPISARSRPRCALALIPLRTRCASLYAPSALRPAAHRLRSPCAPPMRARLSGCGRPNISPAVRSATQSKPKDSDTNRRDRRRRLPLRHCRYAACHD